MVKIDINKTKLHHSMSNAQKRQLFLNDNSNTLLDYKYRDMISYIERLHRLIVDVIKTELERHNIQSVNAVQALIIHNISDSEITVGELKTRGYYLGSNVSYNLKKLVENDYVSYAKSHIDRRSMRIKLTKEGWKICDIINQLYQRHTEKISKEKILNEESLDQLCSLYGDIEDFWNSDIYK